MASSGQDVSEAPLLPRSRSLSFYVTLLFAVLPLWSSIPLSWLFAGYSLYSGKWRSYHLGWRALFFVALCEVVFSIYHYFLARRVSRPTPLGPGHPDEIQVAYIRLLKTGMANLPEDGGDIETLEIARPGSPAETITQLERDDPRAVDFRNSIRTWFCKVPWSSIKLVEAQKWLYWAMYNAELPPLEDLPETNRSALNDALALFQRRVGCKIEEGSNPHAMPMRLTIDNTLILWRPLSFYLLVGTINWGLRLLYKSRWNANHGYFNGLEYILRVPPNWDPQTSPRPVVFLHGLGLGLLQYHHLISHLIEEFPNRPLLVPLQPQISQDFFHPDFLNPPGRAEMAARIAGLIQHLGWAELVGEKECNTDSEEDESLSTLTDNPQRGVTLLSHSNGSYVHAWMLKGYPEIIGRSCFVDPVTFCSWEGDVCYNFFYRPCMNGIELIMRYFVGTELGVSNLLQRHFCWTSNSLWFEEIPNATDPSKTMFLLGGNDAIVNSERVKRYLSSHGVRKGLWFDPEGIHGQALVRGGPGMNIVLKWLSEHED
ncbi:hypothetical protein CPB83DRAFT_902204 [Crepidotus variabilis]|uniref:Uncharacterized protein n=1 Tax=Crepidotus variabilis TaxID=179855 RepID=A0A9P6ESQ7_9AGAR|nr:hypothetical protein CPB83DRAFT_902204 [Crepidotus variabilis]